MRYSARIKHQRDITNMGIIKTHSSRKIKSLVDLEKNKLHRLIIQVTFMKQGLTHALWFALLIWEVLITPHPLPPSPHDSYPNLNCNQVSYFPFILKERCNDIPWLTKFENSVKFSFKMMIENAQIGKLCRLSTHESNVHLFTSSWFNKSAKSLFFVAFGIVLPGGPLNSFDLTCL